MAKYYAQFTIKKGRERKVAMLPICTSIKSLEKKVRDLIAWQKYTPKEITVFRLKRRPNRPVIHGFYKWSDEKMILDKSKPVEIHNVLYGLE